LANIRHYEDLSRANAQLVTLRRERDEVEREIGRRERLRQDAAELSARRDEINFEMEMLFQRRRALIASIEFSRQGR
jgi:cell division protein FtsB